MKSANNIKRLFLNAAMSTNPNMDQAVLEKVLNANEKVSSSESATTRPSMGRMLMKSPTTRIAAAAVTIIACSIGVYIWSNTGAGMALADVLTKLEQVTRYRYKVRSTTTTQQTTGIRAGTVLVSEEHGLKMTLTEVDPNEIKSTRGKYAVGDQWYLLLRSNSIVIVSPEKKTYDRFIYDGVELDFYKEQYNDPCSIVKQILDCEHTSLGQSVIDEIAVEGFQTTDLTYGGGFFGKSDRVGKLKRVDVRLWVDVNTFLPVRLEEDIITENDVHVHEVNYDFQWNVTVEPGDFEPNIPEGYRAPVGDITISAPGEENTIEGLRVFADAAGKYPNSLEQKAFGQEFKKLMAPDPNSYEELSDEERTKKTNEALLIAGPSFFYGTLVDEKKDPAYYGETVGPDDADRMLLRWKLGEGQYRVVFGDLRAKTVTSEELAELEEP